MTPLEDTYPGVRRERVNRTTGPVGTVRKAWAAITEPRHMSVIYGAIYTVAAFGGVVTLVVPPQTISGELGPALSAIWACLFLGGGLLGMSTVLQGWWKWERWASAFMLAGLGIYAFVIASLHLSEQGSRLTQLSVLLLAASVFIVRLALIRGRTYGPTPRG